MRIINPSFLWLIPGIYILASVKDITPDYLLIAIVYYFLIFIAILDFLRIIIKFKKFKNSKKHYVSLIYKVIGIALITLSIHLKTYFVEQTKKIGDLMVAEIMDYKLHKGSYPKHPINLSKKFKPEIGDEFSFLYEGKTVKNEPLFAISFQMDSLTTCSRELSNPKWSCYD